MEVGSGLKLLQGTRKALKKLAFIAGKCYDNDNNNTSTSTSTSSSDSKNINHARQCLNENWHALLRDNALLVEELCKVPSTFEDIETEDGHVSSIFWPRSDSRRGTGYLLTS